MIGVPSSLNSFGLGLRELGVPVLLAGKCGIQLFSTTESKSLSRITTTHKTQNHMAVLLWNTAIVACLAPALQSQSYDSQILPTIIGREYDLKCAEAVFSRDLGRFVIENALSEGVHLKAELTRMRTIWHLDLPPLVLPEVE